MARVLVVDDDADVAYGLKLLLERAGHAVTTARNGREGLRAFFREHAELVVLDVGMPEMDGWETLARLRDVSDAPVLMLTARGLVQERVRGLQAGADDYQTKPFASEELLARVAALLRRSSERSELPETYADEHVTVDLRNWQVSAGGRDVHLTPLEFRLLRAFVTHPRQVLSHSQLLDLAWGDSAPADQGAVKTYVRYLRRKLGWHSGEDGPIESVRGVGYRYRAAREAAPGREQALGSSPSGV
ncbi:MAG TPA: response regulator transcription factor [Solirubrobacteraceae bacterium]|jgi:DNA-binding response OmpR family regulator|nr:response regulator transcription factor [Solirubrobacteraceae bacterium]